MPAETPTPPGVAQAAGIKVIEPVREGPARPIDFQVSDLTKIRSSSPLAVREQSVSPAQPLPPIDKKLLKPKEVPLGQYDDERNNQPDPNFSPMEIDPAVLPDGSEITRKLIQEDFAHLSRTRDLEAGTDRTRLIEEEVLSKLTKGKNIKTRVVIMRKGEHANAFVYPDGTIFITQSLLNQLTSLDELAFVLGHEVGHLINKTSYRVNRAGTPLGRKAAGWVHEAGCDYVGTELAEDAGFNSTAGKRALQDVLGNGRGDIHQSGTARAAQIEGKHQVRESKTSSVPLTPLQDTLRGEFKKTNLEIALELASASGIKDRIVQKFTKDKDYGLGVIIERMHPEDFAKLYEKIYEGRLESNILGNALRTCNQFITERLIANGYSPDETRIFLLLYRKINHYLGNNNSYIIDQNNPQELNRIVSTVQGLSSQKGRFEDMHKSIFGVEPETDLRLSADPKQRILLAVRDIIYDPNFGNESIFGYAKFGPFTAERYGLATRRQDLIMFLQSITQIHSSYPNNGRENLLMEEATTGVLQAYIERTYLRYANQNNLSLTKEDLTEFFEEIKALNIPIEPSRFEGAFNRPDTETDNEETRKHHANSRTVFRAYQEVYYSENISLEEIDAFFQEFTRPGISGQDILNDQANSGRLRLFVNKCRLTFTKHDEITPETLEAVRYITEKIDSLHLTTDLNLSAILNNQHTFRGDYSQAGYSQGDHPPYPVYQTGEQPNHILDQQIMKFNLKMYFGLNMFKGDSDHFYQFIEDAMGKVDTSNLNVVQLINLCQGIFQIGHDSNSRAGDLLFFGGKDAIAMRDSTAFRITDYERLTKLPLVARILETGLLSQAASITELRGNIVDLVKRTHWAVPDAHWSGEALDLYSDSLFNLVIGRSFRAQFETILSKGIPESEYNDFYQFVANFMPNTPEQGRILRTINLTYLNSNEVPIGNKIDFLVSQFDSVGIEGMLIVAQQITDWKTYQLFDSKLGVKTEDYLNGQGIVKALFVGDLATAVFASHYGDLLNTCRFDPKFKGETTTVIAKQWFESVFGLRSTPVTSGYDNQEGRFVLGANERKAFKSIKDLVEYAQGLDISSRSALIFKALTEQHGAFASSGTRRQLAKILRESLNLPPGYISDVLTSACERGDSSVLVYPAIKMLAPLLFGCLDLGSVDTSQIAKVYGYNFSEGIPDRRKLREILSDGDITRIINSPTRDLSFFGPQYRFQPDCAVAVLAQESNEQYERVETLLRNQFPDNRTSSERMEASELPPYVEAVIRGLESSGAMAVRGMQLAYQFENFPEPVRKRLSRSLDANAGLNKLVFWHNLDKQAKEDPSIAGMLERLTLGEYLGGGSMQTTYAAKYRLRPGTIAGTPPITSLPTEINIPRPSEAEYEDIDVVIKMKNPNLEHTVNTTYGTVVQTCTPIAQRRLGGKAAEYARTTIEVVEMAKEWCLRDLKDPTFEADDDAFGKVIVSFNEQKGEEVFYKPERVFVHPRIQLETRAHGRTLNQILNDETVDIEVKRGLIMQLNEFFAHQLKNKDFDKNGEVVIHSDPHAGNYMVDFAGGRARIGVIDRHMYLRQKREDIEAIERLIIGGNDNEFVYGFVDRVIDLNRDREEVRTKLASPEGEYAIVQSVISAVALEYGKQRVTGNIDRKVLMRTLLTALRNNGLRIDLDPRLMIRNIEATREQSERFGVDFNGVYRQTA